MADESRFSAIIDEDGQLFGVINIIDALIALVVLAVVLAGVSLVFASGQSGASDSDTRYVSIEVTPQSEFVAAQIDAGDEWTPEEGSGRLTVTDTYKFNSPGDEGDVGVIIRAAVNGTEVTAEDSSTDPALRFGDELLRFGRTMEIATSEYRIEGEVTAVDQTGTELVTERRSFVLQTEISQSVASNIQTGDRFEVGNASLLTVESVTVYPTAQPDTQRVVLGVSADTLTRGDTVLLGNRPLQDGSSVSIQTAEYQLTGQVLRRGSLEEPGAPATRTVTLDIAELSPTKKSALQAGLIEESRTTQTAEVITVQNETLTIEANVRAFDDGRVQFRGSRLSIGEDMTLEFDQVRITGSVQQIEG